MDNNERPTAEFTTSRGTLVKHRSFITGRETKEIEAVYTKGAKVEVINNAPQMVGFDPMIEQSAMRKALELVLVSIDGESQKDSGELDENGQPIILTVADLALDLPSDEYMEIEDLVSELTGKKKV